MAKGIFGILIARHGDAYTIVTGEGNRYAVGGFANADQIRDDVAFARRTHLSQSRRAGPSARVIRYRLRRPRVRAP